MDKLAAIRAFVSVAEEGGFSAAAEELGLSKSAASRQIAALEADVGAQLLKRSTRTVALTESGYAYLERARAILADIEEADHAVAELHSEPKGTLKINAPMSFGVQHIAPAAIAFMQQFPELRVALILNDRFVDPYEEGFDVTLRIGDLQDSGLSARRLTAIDRGLYAAPAYLTAHGHPQSVDDLSSHATLHYGPPGPSPRWVLHDRQGEASVPITERLCSNNGDVLKSAGLAGLGIMLLPTFFVRSELASGALVQVLPDAAPPPLGLYAIYPPTRFVPAKIRVFIDFLAERFRKTRP